MAIHTRSSLDRGGRAAKDLVFTVEDQLLEPVAVSAKNGRIVVTFQLRRGGLIDLLLTETGADRFGDDLKEIARASRELGARVAEPQPLKPPPPLEPAATTTVPSPAHSAPV